MVRRAVDDGVDIIPFEQFAEILEPVRHLAILAQAFDGPIALADAALYLMTHNPELGITDPYALTQEQYAATLELALVATAVATALGIPLGVWAAARRGRFTDLLMRLVAVTSVSVPVFWSALILQLFFASELGWFPLAGRTSSDTSFDEPTGFALLDATLSGDPGNLADVMLHLAMPTAVMAAYPLGLTIRLIRGSMIEVLSEPYIEAARLAGVAERTVLFRLALKNALAPALTILGLTFAYSVSSAFLVESVFNWPGLGRYLTDAIVRVDFPVITAAALVITVIYVVVNLVLDLVQARLDPRVVLE